MISFVLLLSSLTYTGTVTAEDPQGVVRPVREAVVVLGDDGATRAKRRAHKRSLLSIHCGTRTSTPAVAAVLARDRIQVINDWRGLMPVRIDGADGLSILSATLVSRGQATPQVRLPPGRVRVRCGAGEASVTTHLLVLDHERFQTTDEHGHFTFRPIEASARATVWHPAWGRVETTLTATVAMPRPLF